MPNWVFNSLVVSGEKSELDKMVAQLNQPFEKHFPDSKWNEETKQWDKTPAVQVYDNPVFAFWNIVKPTDISAYYETEVFSKKTLEPDDFMAEFVRSMREDQDWYHWNCRNWGTKWDIGVVNGDEYPNTIKTVNDDGSIMYHFETAWSPVGEVLMKLSEMYPTLEFDYEYEEEQGWGGELEILRGNVTTNLEYETRCYSCDSYDCVDYCENDCGQFCSECQEGSWRDEEAMKECQTHMVLLDTTEKAEV